MQISRATLSVVLALLLGIAPLAAQERHVATETQIEGLIAAQQDADRADREVVLETLRHPEVRRLALAAALPMDKAEAAVATLEGDELAQIAAQARSAQAALAGGATTVTISTTLIIIVLLIIILIVVAD